MASIKEIFADPADDALIEIDLVSALLKSVRLTRIENELGSRAKMLERRVKLNRLGGRRGFVTLTVNHEQRRFDTIGEGNRRTRTMQVEIIIDVRGEHGGLPFAIRDDTIVRLIVGDVCSGDSTAETVGLRDD